MTGNFRRRFIGTGHLRVHTSEKPFLCTRCGQKFHRENDLDVHQQMHNHEQTSPSTSNASGHTSSSDKTDQAVISKISFDEKLFACSVCNKILSQKSHLDRHMLIHSGLKPYACDICMKTFSQKVHLDKHSRVHTGEKLFACTICDKRFSQKTHLNIHTNIHTGEKPFVCTMCDKTFTQKTHLDNHITIHTGEKRFACLLCERRFSQKTHLDRHCKNIHKVDPKLTNIY